MSWTAWAVLALLAGRAGAAAGEPRQAGVPAAAIWREQHVDFYYRGRTARYSCDGLRNKVRAMLLDVGARRDLKVDVVGCIDAQRASDADKGPRLSITFSVPVPRDPARASAADGAPEAWGARFEAFAITADAFRNLGLGDCELVQEFARQLLAKFVTRHLQRDITCVPYRLSGNKFLVKGEVLRVP